jgi:hypothetical protein
LAPRRDVQPSPASMIIQRSAASLPAHWGSVLGPPASPRRHPLMVPSLRSGACSRRLRRHIIDFRACGASSGYSPAQRPFPAAQPATSDVSAPQKNARRKKDVRRPKNRINAIIPFSITGIDIIVRIALSVSVGSCGPRFSSIYASTFLCTVYGAAASFLCPLAIPVKPSICF